MNIQSLFGPVSIIKFVQENLHRLPFAVSGTVHERSRLGSWESLGEILAAGGADAMVVREGQPFPELAPTTLAIAQALSGDGYTIVVRHAERQHAGLAELARAFEETFCGPVDVQMFVTPAGAAGFSWHYDAEDVFILQTAGEKQYSLRKNTVNPWPLEETLPADMRYERESMPLMQVLLQAGDLVYVPCGYWHKADAGTSKETAISLAVGVMSRTAVDVFDFLRRRVVDSLLWRQRLPIVGAASGVSEADVESAYRELFAQLAPDIERTLLDPHFVREYLKSYQPPDERE